MKKKINIEKTKVGGYIIKHLLRILIDENMTNKKDVNVRWYKELSSNWKKTKHNNKSKVISGTIAKIAETITKDIKEPKQERKENLYEIDNVFINTKNTFVIINYKRYTSTRVYTESVALEMSDNKDLLITDLVLIDSLLYCDKCLKNFFTTKRIGKENIKEYEKYSKFIEYAEESLAEKRIETYFDNMVIHETAAKDNGAYDGDTIVKKEKEKYFKVVKEDKLKSIAEKIEELESEEFLYGAGMLMADSVYNEVYKKIYEIKSNVPNVRIYLKIFREYANFKMRDRYIELYNELGITDTEVWAKDGAMILVMISDNSDETLERGVHTINIHGGEYECKFYNTRIDGVNITTSGLEEKYETRELFNPWMSAKEKEIIPHVVTSNGIMLYHYNTTHNISKLKSHIIEQLNEKGLLPKFSFEEIGDIIEDVRINKDYSETCIMQLIDALLTDYGIYETIQILEYLKIIQLNTNTSKLDFSKMESDGMLIQMYNQNILFNKFVGSEVYKRISEFFYDHIIGLHTPNSKGIREHMKGNRSYLYNQFGEYEKGPATYFNVANSIRNNFKDIKSKPILYREAIVHGIKYTYFILPVVFDNDKESAIKEVKGEWKFYSNDIVWDFETE